MFWLRVISGICLLEISVCSAVLFSQNPTDSGMGIVSENVNVQKTFQSLSRPGLQNVFQVDDRIYSGSTPEGKKGFEVLKKMGIKTIVSVDGVTPKLKLAKETGINYVHIPIGYDGISHEAGLAFARVSRDLQGSIYIHCHHGRHRGPAAAAIVGLCRGSFDKKQAFLFLEQAGTSKAYAGLWRDIGGFQVPSPNIKLPNLVASAKVDPMVTAMVNINDQFEQLELLSASESPDEKETLQIILLLQEGFHETSRKYASDYDETFKKWLNESEAHFKRLGTAIRKGDQEQIVSRLKSLKSQCKRCHQKYRD